MKFILSALLAIFATNVFAQTSQKTDIQFQAHAPAGTPAQSKLSIYLADDTFNENSHLNTTSFWYVENVDIEIVNGIVNYTLENVSNIILLNYQSNLFVYSYINGQSLGKFRINKVPYALKAEYSIESENSKTSLYADSSSRSGLSFRSYRSDSATVSQNAWVAVHSKTSDTTRFALFADTARAAGKATLSDLATYSSTSAHAAKADTSVYANTAGRAFDADTSVFAYDADHANFASTSAFATNAARSVIADTAKTLIDNSIEHRHFQSQSVRLSSLEGSSTAPVGSYAIRGASGISWEVNPQHRTSSVSVYTSAPASLPTDSRWVVSRVAVDYDIASVTSPTTGQLVTVFNGSTANAVTIKNSIWGTDTALDYPVWPNQSRTLWYDGTKWVVVQ